jgi:hypothetical protein
MTTLLDISLKITKEVQDVIEGTATGGSTTTLVDTALGTLPNDHFNNGRLWIKSGTHADKIFQVTDFTTSTGTVTFAAVTGAIAAGVRYAIARNAYPWDQVVSAIQRALESTWVTGIDSTLEGDGQTLEFTLPTGVYDIKRVEFSDPAQPHTGVRNSTHWKETSTGKLRFDYGYAPIDGYTIHVHYRDQHAELTDYTVVISNEINIEWLKWAAAQELLWWGVSMYGQQVEYRIEERMNKVMAMLKGKTPRRDPDFVIHTAGG